MSNLNDEIVKRARAALIDTAKKALSEKECNVTFTKLDGTERQMRCTRAMFLIPESARPTGSDDRHYDEDTTYRVFDLDKQEWRSFKWDNVIEFNGWKR